MKILINKTNTNNQSILSDINGNKRLNKITNSIFFNESTKSKELSIQDLKIHIEINQILNYPYEFLSLDKSQQCIPSIIKINLVDNINIPVSEDIFEHYNKKTGEITITEKLLFNEQFLPNTFPEHLHASVGQSKLLMFAILHKIGHAIHHQLFLKQDNNLLIPSVNDFNNNDFLNLIANNGLYLLGKSTETKKHDINHAISYSIKEGFADLYASIALTKIYPKEVALNFIDEVIEARITGNDNYYTTDSLKLFKNDFKNNNVNLITFKDLHEYINETISKTALKTMLEKLDLNNPIQIKHNNAFAGFLKSLTNKAHQQEIFTDDFLINAKSINDVIKILDLNKNEFHFKLENIKEDKEIFNKGYEITKESINDVMDTDFLSTKLTKSNKNIDQENGKLCLTEYNEKPKSDIQNKMLEMRNKAFKNNKNLICKL